MGNVAKPQGASSLSGQLCAYSIPGIQCSIVVASVKLLLVHKMNE